MVRTRKEQSEDNDELIDPVAQDVLGHGAGDEGLVPAVGLPHEEGLGGGLCGQGEGGECVHDQVHPQHLYGLQGRVLGPDKPQ